jgi:hypothetical protein
LFASQLDWTAKLEHIGRNQKMELQILECRQWLDDVQVGLLVLHTWFGFSWAAFFAIVGWDYTGMINW